jgi:hypothetical protein
MRSIFLLAATSAAMVAIATSGIRTAAADQLGPHLFDLELGGYGEIGFSYFNYAENQNRPGGAQRDHRLGFDTKRFTAAIEGHMVGGIEFEAELEIEHGGAGVAKEVEFEEFGEFETEVERGGEVNLEEMYLKRSFGRYTVGVGRFYVAVGNRYHRFRPDHYLGASRNEAETALLTSHWNEIGAEVSAMWPGITATLQVVNGLDSSGFSSRTWVAGGHQGRFETTKASNLAGVARVDYHPNDTFEIGASLYVGGSNRNRPKADLVNDCAADDSQQAPCGYPASTAWIGDVHTAWNAAGVRGQAVAIFGHLKGAKAISDRNTRLANELGVERTPVADNAAAASVEIGYDIAPLLKICADNALEPYLRFDYYDTMVKVRKDLFDNKRFSRRLFSMGVAHTFKKVVTSKLEIEHRRFGSKDLRPETAVNLSFGFVY